MHKDGYEEILKHTYIIGIYGSEKETPDFIPCLERSFSAISLKGHVLGLERHLYGHKMSDSLLDSENVRQKLAAFI